MAGKAINQYSEYTGPASGVNILVQEVSQTDPNTFEHKKANLADMVGEGITQEITEDDTTHAPSGDAVYQALEDKADQSDLTDEVTARQTADTNLNNALTAIDHRVENLEQPKGGYVVNTYKDGSITPSGKGAWAIVEGLRGVSRVENGQLGPTLHAGSMNNGITPSYDASTQTMGLSGTSTGSFDAILIDAVPILTPGHTYLVAIEKSATGFTFTDNYQALSNTASYVFTAGNQNPYFNIRARGNAGVTPNYEGRIGLTDLNVYFNTSDLSFLGATDSAKLATIQKDYPHLLIPSDYGTRIVDSSYSGVRAWARNLLDKTQIKDTTYGTPTISGERISVTGTYYCSFNINLEAGQYYLKFTVVSYTGSRGVRLQYEDGTLVDTLTSSGLVTLTKKATTVLLYCGSGSSATSVYEDICINKSDSLDGTFTPYHAPSTLSLTFTGKSAGSVYDSCEPNVEVNGVARRRETQRVDSYTFDGTENWSKSGDYYRLSKFDSTILQPQNDTTVPAVLLEGYIATMWQTTADKAVYIGPSNVLQNSKLWVRDTAGGTEEQFAQSMIGRTIHYAVIDPVVTLSDPIIDNTLLTESGGRMATVQTGTVVDGSYDMGFINL